MNIVIQIQKRSETIENRIKFVFDTIEDRFKQNSHELMYKFMDLTRADDSRESKIFKLNQFADIFVAMVEDLYACKLGCSKCCYQRIPLSQTEANIIASKTSTAAVQLAADFQMKGVYEYDQTTPCTFLKNGSCSIYEHRPFACRKHINLDIDNLLCEFENWETLPNNPNLVVFPQLQFAPLLEAHSALCENDICGDIRDFFPDNAK